MLAPRRCEPAAAPSLATRLPPLSPCHSGSNALLMRWHHNAAGSRRGPGCSAYHRGHPLGVGGPQREPLAEHAADRVSASSVVSVRAAAVALVDHARAE